ncbi:MAG: bifunctional 2-C-methyl-D-erythritol 4-phosphate cytidylyltransferase/2-C-methyl-D-erythritol 2,4-cyclodiphosphate synthase [Brevundimonas sp.]|uniref:bifunctional 2-C-methyl-D-erythritol 4-phosphate cytidylyltransferase/2-C-methyl-D-erythritol 2,4-cyclodiphosphate synthase n=1 Tax=Brevundimonas sp. TaxID=1871086 RepID=UPI002ABC5AC5|nr:bifunctional 2-C-methyl-D-erythritol 4-phosphate cytidylyltransferase/2-C-methyl-D-erythritol 2,4-cyclodiphosphate synthase [Brevundimonas sp.]MDZ4112876.1 bifunctional 2-C-methyl-D-erythritol 4-phosphate cytidylyltransferase/2-C-methyl-D-erythritol 2,4-cyclodiphosphate synthase [Brevundimonas sp.]
MTFQAVVVAAGSGSRAGVEKPWVALAGVPVLRWSVRALLEAGAGDVVVVVGPHRLTDVATALEGLEGWRAVEGGATRAESVMRGLDAIDAERAARADTPVLIHDAARPFLERAVIDRLIEAMGEADGAVPALPAVDSLRRGDGAGLGESVDRDGLFRAQTPQAFRLATVRAALTGWTGAVPPTDEAEAVRAAGGRVVLVAGDPRLFKLTYPEDFIMAEALAAGLTPPSVTRVGQGFDVHRWGPGTSVWLCGVEIPHDRTLIGHSDADAGLHALTDAILGAMGDGDIGDHFPPSDPQWKGASSDRFLVHAVERLAARGGQLVNVDVTLICEEPKIKPHRQAMRDRLAELCAIPLDAVSVKATTTEQLGFTGRGEGLAAQAVATITLPASR